jgi:hypothetical protein
MENSKAFQSAFSTQADKGSTTAVLARTKVCSYFICTSTIPDTSMTDPTKKYSFQLEAPQNKDDNEAGHPTMKVVQTMYALSDYKTMGENQTKMLLYTFAILVYLAINLALFGLNFRDQDFIEENYYYPFHLLEFWAVFFFTLIEAFVLVSTGTLNINGPWSHVLQIGLALFDILFTLIIAIIFSMDPHEYEVPAHFMEYSAQIFITVVNFFFVVNYLRNNKNQDSVFYRFRHVEVGLTVITFLLSILQLLIYTEVIETDPGGERSAHFVEFITESLNALTVLWFSAVTYKQMNEETEYHYTKMRELV